MLKKTMIESLTTLFDELTQNLINQEYCNQCNPLKRVLCYLSPCKGLQEISNTLSNINGVVDEKKYRYKLDTKIYTLVSISYSKPSNNKLYVLSTQGDYHLYSFTSDYFEQYFTEIR